ncbi:hypothetical protein MMC09_003520 [Bachmanniomyces sp. S44760]|nr:hypothetical protein [Bachmanniomyces sp. S44760]
MVELANGSSDVEALNAVTMPPEIRAILDDDGVPSDRDLVAWLSKLESFTRNWCTESSTLKSRHAVKNTPVNNLLSLEKHEEQDRRRNKSSTMEKELPTSPGDSDTLRMQNGLVDKVSNEIDACLQNPNVFISPKFLELYVKTKIHLGHFQSLPSMFALYASKPVPLADTRPARYKAANPASASAAIPLPVANLALTAAMEGRDLAICLDIIDSTVRTQAYTRNKLVKRALVPATGAILAPVAAFTLASQLSVFQDTMDPTTATNIAFVGILAYLGYTSVIGVVALTTANDQMDRVTWAQGTPLHLRWLREDERAMWDRIAGAWGFKDVRKRGEEEGHDWKILKEMVGLRGMVLDKTELMEGME